MRQAQFALPAGRLVELAPQQAEQASVVPAEMDIWAAGRQPSVPVLLDREPGATPFGHYQAAP